MPMLDFLGGVFHIDMLMECEREVVLRWKISKHLFQSVASGCVNRAVEAGHFDISILIVKFGMLVLSITHSIALRGQH